MEPKVIAFDLFGTVFDLKDVPREEIRAYLKCCVSRPWRAQSLPKSWESLPVFEDSVEGINRLARKYLVTTCSNGPVDTVRVAAEKAGLITWGYTPLEQHFVYKPDPLAYLAVCARYDVNPDEVMMVTANPTFAHFDFGDIQMAKAIGMQAQLIRNPGCPQTIIELAESLGC
jgi:HAD superfamily hydrolase (TIGR01493 family)